MDECPMRERAARRGANLDTSSPVESLLTRTTRLRVPVRWCVVLGLRVPVRWPSGRMVIQFSHNRQGHFLRTLSESRISALRAVVHCLSESRLAQKCGSYRLPGSYQTFHVERYR